MALIAGCIGLFPAAPLVAGTEVLLYPFARAFGSPSEAELARCRAAFRQFQARDADCRVLVQPVMFVSRQQSGSTVAYRADLADDLIKRLTPALHAGLCRAETVPAVARADFKRNQLRYTWTRAAQYSDYTARAHPKADYVLFTEVWAAGRKVAALQIYLLNSSGQIAYCRLFNSHQFGNALPLEGPAWMEFLTRHFLQDLSREPGQVFPKYGVG